MNIHTTVLFILCHLLQHLIGTAYFLTCVGAPIAPGCIGIIFLKAGISGLSFGFDGGGACVISAGFELEQPVVTSPIPVTTTQNVAKVNERLIADIIADPTGTVFDRLYRYCQVGKLRGSSLYQQPMHQASCIWNVHRKM